MTSHPPGEEPAPVQPEFHPETRQAWRDWLAANHATSTGVWLVGWRSQTGRPAVPYVETVEEALCFGWIDAKNKRLDDERTAIWMCPRKATGGWARTNKERVARLEAAGLMTAAGRRAIEVAKANGAWTRLDDVENLVVPDDLAAALDARAGARDRWDGFPPSARRVMLDWLSQARRPATRQSRVDQIADGAARGERAYPRPAATGRS